MLVNHASSEQGFILCFIENFSGLCFISSHLTCRPNATTIISELQSRIDEFKVPHSFPFSWSNKLFVNPPKKEAKDFEMSDEQIARIEAIVQDKARKRYCRY